MTRPCCGVWTIGSSYGHPLAIAGLIEVRGVGILRVDSLDEAPLALVVDLVPSAQVERIPDNRFEEILGLAVPLIALAAFEASAAAKLRLARRTFAVPAQSGILGS